VWHERKAGAAADARDADKHGAELARLRDAWEARGDRRALFYLANGLRESGRYDEAVEAYERYLGEPNFADEAWQARLYLARCHAATADWLRARRRFEEAVLAGPERAEALIGLGHVRLAEGDAEQAAAWFRMATAVPPPIGCRLFVEVPAYRWGAWHGLALALDAQRDYAGAADAESRAMERGAGPWAADNVAWWRARAAETAADGADRW
jgi:tetratricopeptide (TPR) repeat protein